MSERSVRGVSSRCVRTCMCAYDYTMSNSYIEYYSNAPLTICTITAPLTSQLYTHSTILIHSCTKHLTHTLQFHIASSNHMLVCVERTNTKSATHHYKHTALTTQHKSLHSHITTLTVCSPIRHQRHMIYM